MLVPDFVQGGQFTTNKINSFATSGATFANNISDSTGAIRFLNNTLCVAYPDGTSSRFLTSTNYGSSYTVFTRTSSSFRGFTYMPNVNRYILTSNNLVISFDGSSFTTIHTSGLPNQPRYIDCAYSPKLGRTIIVAVNSNGTATNWVYTDNGTSVSNTASQQVGGVYGQKMTAIWVDEFDKFFVAANANIRTSSDGITWSSVYSGTNNQFIAYSPSLGMLRASSAYSYDGVNWTNTTSIGASGTLEIHWCPDLGVFYCGDAISSDGINFISVSGLTSYSSTWIPQQMSFFGLNASTNNSITRSQN